MGEAVHWNSWPNYEAAYLAKRLGSRNPTAAYTNRYQGGLDINNDRTDLFEGMDSAEKAIYLDRVTANYKKEADECLKNEFVDWLQGQHEDNRFQRPYENGAGKPLRRWVYQNSVGGGGGFGSGTPGTPLNDWTPTWWGTGQLTHLDGVRDFLKSDRIRSDEHSFLLNLLAEHGPQNIEQAWAYFKHWVKGRPLTEDECIHLKHKKDEKDMDRAPAGPIPSDSFYVPQEPKDAIVNAFPEYPATPPTATAPSTAIQGRQAFNSAMNKITGNAASTAAVLGTQWLQGVGDLAAAAGREFERAGDLNATAEIHEREKLAELAVQLEKRVQLLEGQNPRLLANLGADRVEEEAKDLTEQIGQLTTPDEGVLDRANTLVDNAGAATSSRFARLQYALSPGPVAGAVGGAAYNAGRLGVTVAAAGSSRIFREAADYLLSAEQASSEEEPEEYFMQRTEEDREKEQLMLQGQQGWTQLGFRDSTLVRR